jgi:predicted dinucleotide-binding enzyme
MEIERMRIAVIGSGNVGRALGGALVSAGHEVTMSDADRASAVQAAAHIAASAAESNSEAVASAELVILAVPGSIAPDVASEIAAAAVGKIVVDSTNPLNESLTDLVYDDEASGAHAIQRKLPGVPVVKAFNTIFAGRHGSPEEDGVPLDAFFAGEDDAAKEIVARLVRSLGFRGIDVGDLRLARALEEMALLNITLNARNNLPWQSGWKLIGPVAN